jgi:hypothetical protein
MVWHSEARNEFLGQPFRLIRLPNFTIATVEDWTESGIGEKFSYGVHN